MPMLAKLFILSSVVHQAIFSLVSSLPYAVGQVQDAGLIFLSKIATSVVFLLQDKPAEVVVSTTLVTLALCTALLGITLIGLGHYKLARLVSYLPLPVIGGQIVFIAAFCFRAGVALSVGHDLDSLQAWGDLYDPHSVVLVLPGILAGVGFSAVARSFKHFLALPLAMVCVPLAFYGVLYLGGETMDGARDFGWLGPSNVPASWQSSLALYQVWPLSSLGGIEWWVLPYQLPTLLGMIFVVSFSSCLDIVAIEMDGGRPLNKNHELSTVGLSNLIAGVCGGFTGSYIFSQSIFTFRTGTRSRFCGLVLIVAELAVFLSPIDLMTYIPLYFFAATLHFITFELMIEWLVEARRRMTRKEYLVLWVTFIGNVSLGIIPGFALGIVLSMAMFIVSYAKSTARTAQAQRQRSRVVRLREARRLLDQRGKILTLELNGAIFFGSSVTTLEHIKSLLGVAPSSPRVAGAGAGAKAVGKGAKAAGGAAATGAYRPSRTHSRRVPGEEGRNGGGGSKTFRSVKSVVGMWWKRLRQSIIQGVDEEERREEDTDEDEEKAGELRPLKPLPPAEDAARLGALLAVPAASNSSSSTYGALRPPSHQRQRSDSSTPSSAQQRRPHTHKPRFLILDFRRVSAIDMSSVVNCFLPLQTLCKDMGVVLCYSNCNVRVEFYLRANRLLEDTNTRLFPTLHQALDSCETALLGEESVHTQGHSVRARAFSLRGVQELSVVSVLRTMLFEEEEEEEEEEGKEEEEEEEGEGGQATARSINEAALETIAHYAREERYQEQETIFYKGDPSDSFYLILAGEVALEAADDGDEDGLEDDALLDVHLRGVERPEEGDGRQRHVEVVLHSGSLFGFVDFFLENQRRRFFARAMTPVKLGVFSQTALRRLEAENPRLMVLVQKLLLKQFSIELGNVSAL
jgi:MFS superfamily sulfate permease-like transporter/CRP-like cAMP-binding protein